jgi:hypothetical protein
MPVLSEEEQTNVVGGYHVVITVTRCGYGNNSTVSMFTATAYDNCGQVVGTPISGYMLEPATNYDLATTAGSDTAISAGSYSVVYRADGRYEITGVPGRSGILIHTGASVYDTTGCFLPTTSVNFVDNSGSSYVYNPSSDSVSYYNSSSDSASYYNSSSDSTSYYNSSSDSTSYYNSNSDSTSYYNSSSDPNNPYGDYYVPENQGYSTAMFNTLTNLMQQWGQEGVTININ